MYVSYNKNYNERAKILRKNMTQEERKLWYLFLRKHKERFLRQKVIDNYIVDFYCPNKRLIIEIDGSQHYTVEGMGYDKIRTEILNLYNLNVIRFSNLEINKNFKEVCEFINYNLYENPPTLRATSFIKGGKIRGISKHLMLGPFTKGAVVRSTTGGSTKN